MPYLASNQDVRENDTFKTVLMAGAAILGGAALGSMAMKNATKAAANSGSKGVSKSLYGDMAKSLDKEVVKNITVPEVNMNGPQMIYKDGRRGRAGKFKAQGGTRGERRAMKDQLAEMNQYVTDLYGKPEELGWASQKIRNAKDKWFKRPTSTMANANEAGQYGALSASKLSVYEDLAKKSQASGYNVDAANLSRATDDIYNSAGNRAARRSEGIKNMVDDAEMTNAIWDGNVEAKIAKENKKIEKANKKAIGQTRRGFGTDDISYRTKKGVKASKEVKEEMLQEAAKEKANKYAAFGVDGVNYRITNPTNNPKLQKTIDAKRLEQLRERKKAGWTSNANMQSPVGKKVQADREAFAQKLANHNAEQERKRIKTQVQKEVYGKGGVLDKRARRQHAKKQKMYKDLFGAKGVNFRDSRVPTEADNLMSAHYMREANKAASPIESKAKRERKNGSVQSTQKKQ